MKLFFFLFIFLSGFLGNRLLAQVFISPARDPRVSLYLNPKNNPSVNPDLSSNIHPKYNSRLNPKFNMNISPVSNSKINPIMEIDLNPNLNSSINPDFNSQLNPAFSGWKGFVIYDMNAQPIGIVTKTEDGKVLNCFDMDLKRTGFWVYNSEGGFNLFDLDVNFSGQLLIPDLLGGYNVFDENSNWTGYLR